VRRLSIVFALAIACVAASGAAARLVEHDMPYAPPSPPQPPVPAPAWKLPIAFTAWGFEDGTLRADVLAARLVEAGVRSIAIQIGPSGPRVAPSDMAILDTAGLDVYLWGIANDGDHQAALEAVAGIVDGYIAQVENDEQYAALLDSLEAGVGEHMPRAVVTTFEGVNTTHNGLVQTPERMQPLIAAGITTAFVECYLQDDPRHGDLPLMLWQARQYGWARAVPVIGLFRGYRLRDYGDLPSLAGAWGFWNAEQIHPDDWRALARQSTAPNGTAARDVFALQTRRETVWDGRPR
jgi:hypothetical protein